MRRRSEFLILSLLIVFGCTPGARKHTGGSQGPLIYEIDLTDRADDLFKVKLQVDNLTEANAIYQFAATAPGTYTVMDIGRFIRSFQAFDSTGQIIPTRQLSTNQWQVETPRAVRQIRYDIAETWDTPVDSNQIFLMAGTSIEDDHVQFMGHCVVGYPTGMQGRPLSIRFKYPEEWLAGTALRKDKDGFYMAENYDHMVDSPILLGRLSKAALKVDGTKIEIYTYSKTDQIKSSDILDLTKEVLNSAAEFLHGLPVDHYTFLYFFEDVTQGAWEHSYSSNYVHKEVPSDQLSQSKLPSWVAHEFFHIVTPLNIHSEIIEQFNFVNPEPSEHLWLYEGATEWAANAMQLRSGLMPLEEYLDVMSTKLKTDDRFDKSLSLRDLALQSFKPSGEAEYANIYMRGALVAGLLDIRILELSQGKFGLREVLNKLSKKYGPHQAFPEKQFYQIFADMTFPEINDFFEKFVKSASPLPIQEYYAKLGISYTGEVPTGEEIASAGFQVRPTIHGEISIMQLHEKMLALGLQDGDVIKSYNGQEISLQNARATLTELFTLDTGIPYELIIKRGKDELSFTCEKFMREKIERHVFEVDENATPAQLALRKAWMKNM